LGKWQVILGILGLLLVTRLVVSYFGHPAYQIGDQVKASFNLPVTLTKLDNHYYWSKFGLLWRLPKNFEANQWGRVTLIGKVESLVISGKKHYIVSDLRHFEFKVNDFVLDKVLKGLRQNLEDRFLRYLASDEAGLAIGLLLGGTEHTSTSLRKAFRNTGLLHIAAASGYNVNLVAGWVMVFATRFFKPRATAIIVLLCIGLYVLLAGGSASIVRAGIMGAVMVVGKLLGRPSDSLWLLLLTGWGMLMWNPGYLGDISWQLSFAATMGLVWFKPKSEWQTTLAAQVTTLPLLMHHFGNLSIIGPVANIAVLWAIPIVMQVLVLSLLVPPVLFLASPILKYIIASVHFFSNLPFASITVQAISWWWVVAYYGVILIGFLLVRSVKRTRTLLVRS